MVKVTTPNKLYATCRGFEPCVDKHFSDDQASDDDVSGCDLNICETPLDIRIQFLNAGDVYRKKVSGHEVL